MNKQGSKAKPRGGIEWTHILGPGTGYTANPVRGCTHGCEWQMPDGAMAICYAKAVAERLATAAYPKGFEHVTYHPEELAAIEARQEPAGIFIDSMADLFGRAVRREWIEAVIEVVARCPQHVFFSLTKNPVRFREFAGQVWPRNWLVGVSAPPSVMYGQRLTLRQQEMMFRKWLEWLVASPAAYRWVSVEPLSFDVADIVAPFASRLDWMVIGAASNGAVVHQPRAEHLRRLLAVYSGRVFFKGNLDRDLARRVAGKWREEFPILK
jgi:protein gp37